MTPVDILEEFSECAHLGRPEHMRHYGFSMVPDLDMNAARHRRWRLDPMNREKKKAYMVEYRKRCKGV
jgi:hypothetical protein